MNRGQYRKYAYRKIHGMHSRQPQPYKSKFKRIYQNYVKNHSKFAKFMRIIKYIWTFFYCCFVLGMILGIIIMTTLLLDDLNIASVTIIILVTAFVIYLWIKTNPDNN